MTKPVEYRVYDKRTKEINDVVAIEFWNHVVIKKASPFAIMRKYAELLRFTWKYDDTKREELTEKEKNIFYYESRSRMYLYICFHIYVVF